jgi:hypothetical protein
MTILYRNHLGGQFPLAIHHIVFRNLLGFVFRLFVYMTTLFSLGRFIHIPNLRFEFNDNPPQASGQSEQLKFITDLVIVTNVLECPKIKHV